MRQMIQKARQRLLGNEIFLVIAFCLLWEPDFIKVRNGLSDDIFDAGTVLLGALLLLFAIEGIRRLVTGANLSFLALGTVLTLSTLIHSGISTELVKCLKYVAPAALIILLVELGCQTDAYRTVQAFYIMCFLNVLINVVSMQLAPGGMYLGHEGEPQYWLGNENVFIMTVLAGLGAGYVNVWQRGKRMSADYLAYLVACVLCVRLSVTSILGLACFLAFFLLHFLTKARWPFDPFLHQALGWGAFWGIVVFRVHYYFSFLIVDVFHKDLTLTNRTKLWRRVIRQFWQSPVLGYGVRTAEAFRKSLGKKNEHWIHAHNYCLDLVNKGGVLAVTAYGAGLLFVAWEMRKNLHKEGVRVLAAAILSYLVIFVGDCFEMRTPFYGILALAACSSLLLPRGEEPQAEEA